MITCSENITIAKNLEETYKIAEQYPRFVDFYQKKEIVHSDEIRSEVKIESSFFGLKFSWVGAGIKEKNKKITWTQLEGLLKGMKAEWLFFALDGKTRVDLIVTYSSPIPLWESLAAFIFIKKTIPKILNCFKTACHNAP